MGAALSHEEVALEGRGVIGWLVITATREAWRGSARRELSLDEPRHDRDRDHDPRHADDLFEPVGSEQGPLTVVIERDETRRRLARLTGRERHDLGLQVLGFTYEEISRQTGAGRRTVERQLLRAQRKLRFRRQGLKPGVNLGVRAALSGITLQTITLRGRVVAAASARGMFLCDRRAPRPVEDPERTFVIFMAAFAADLLTRRLPGPYSGQRARRHARAAPIPGELLEHDLPNLERTAQASQVPVNELRGAIAEHDRVHASNHSTPEALP